MSVKQIVISSFNQAFKKYLYNELVVGQLAHVDFKDNIKKGDEVDVIMPGSVSMFDYDGGDLSAPEKATLSTTKVKINKG